MLLCGLLFSVTTISTAHAALTATTANVIEGTAPWFAATSGAKRLGFTVGGKFYSESSTDTATTGNIVESTVKQFNGGLRLDEFIVKQLTASDFDVGTDYADSDGDGAHPTTPFTMRPVEFEWEDNNGTTIPLQDYGKSLGCGSGFSLPLKLIIKLPDVQVHSEYGLPRDSDIKPLTKTYKIDTASGICFAKPNQMAAQPNYTWVGVNAAGNYTSWNDTSNTTPHADNGGGYDANVFDPVNGFKASAATKFPTTGFVGAKFKLIMTGAQSDWTFIVAAGNGVSVSNAAGSEGDVTLESKPGGTGEVTVRATLKNSNPSVQHDYTFNPTTVWAVPKGIGNYAWASGASGCGSASNILTRSELTNSPRNTAPQGWSYVANYYTRAIDGSIFGEWGRSDGTSLSSTPAMAMSITVVRPIAFTLLAGGSDLFFDFKL